MQNKQDFKSNIYFFAVLSFVIGLFTQDFFKIPLTGGNYYYWFNLDFDIPVKRKNSKPIFKTICPRIHFILSPTPF